MTKVTLIRKGQRIPTYIRIDLKSLYQDIRSGAYLNMVEQVREDYPLTLLHNGWKLTDMERLDKVPRICFACEWRKKRNQASIDAFNGLILLESIVWLMWMMRRVFVQKRRRFLIRC